MFTNIMLTFISCFVLYLLANNFCFAEEDFSVVGVLFYGRDGDVVAGFGDFNADKHIDIFVITNLGKQVDVLLCNENGPYSRKALINSSSALRGPIFISGIMLADFDGDGQMDILVNRKNSVSDIAVEVYWGDNNALGSPYLLTGLFKDEPVLFDFNADMLPDLLTEDINGSVTLWLAEIHMHNFSKTTFPYPFKLKVPHSSAFTQLVKEYNTDLVLTTAGNNFTVFADNNYTDPYTVYSGGSNIIGQSSFADFNQDGVIDHIIPVCTQKDKECTRSKIQVYINKVWSVLLDFGDNMKFVMSSSAELASSVKFNFPATLVVGDYNRDGFPDLLVILYSTSLNKTKPFLLKNVPCSISDCQVFGRMFEVQQGALPSDIDDVYQAAFYDLYEDGTLDIVLTVAKPNGTSQQVVPHTVVLRNNLAADTCFMKVTVISGICYPLCQPGNHEPYGVNTPGPTVMYSTVNANGDTQTSCASQLSQSAHFALQLPFVMFGLGQTPNFVDSVTIAIPEKSNEKFNRWREWTQIIPNSQLLVNPNPHDQPTSWKMQLFVMPSKQIYVTAAVLGATCVVLVFIVAILLWREKREDKMEKKQDSHKFHFDAM